MTADSMHSPQRMARLAGALYLVVVVLSIYALGTVSGITVRGDAAATAENLSRVAGPFRLAVVANLVATLCYVAVVGLLNELLKPVDPGISRIAVLFGLGGCIVGAMITALQISALGLLGQTAAADTIQLLMVVAGRTNSVALTLFGCYCLLLGWLVFRSGFIPRLFGLLLMLSGTAWLGGNLAMLIEPGLAGRLMWVIGVGGLGEILFTLWLLVKGVDGGRWTERQHAMLARVSA